MTEFDDDFVPLAVELLEEFGVLAPFEVDPRTYDPSTGDAAPDGPTTHQVKVLPPRITDRYVPADLVRAGRMNTLISASGLAFTPAPGIKVTIYGVEYVLDQADPIPSGTQIAAWRLGAPS